MDRGRGDPANLICVMLEMENGKFRVATRDGVLNTRLERNCVKATKYSSLTAGDVVSDEECSLRELYISGQLAQGRVTGGVHA